MRCYENYQAHMGVSCTQLNNWTGIYILFHTLFLLQGGANTIAPQLKKKKHKRKGERVFKDPLRTVSRSIFLSTITITHSSFADAKYFPIKFLLVHCATQLGLKKKKRIQRCFLLKNSRRCSVTKRTYPFDTVETVKPLPIVSTYRNPL